MNRQKQATADEIIVQAKRHVGYRSQPDRKSAFQLGPYMGKPWNGTFVDRVLHDALGDFGEVRFISTVSALGYYVNRNGVYQKPRPGDVVFFNFATDPQQPFEQPHVGIVTEVNANGSFRTVEGEASPGTPQGSQLADGVFERLRYPTDTIGFIRPKARTMHWDDRPETVKMSYFSSNPGTKSKAVATVQRALNIVRPKWTFNRGKKDGVFKSAFGAYARETGTVQNRGELTAVNLQILADESGTLEVDTQP